MQINSGIRSLLRVPFVYNLAMGVLRNGNNEWFISDVLALQGGETIIDMGCGTGTILDLLPANVRYTGLDINAAYIESGRKRYPRARFIAGSLDDWSKDQTLGDADLFLCNGVLHHLDDGEVNQTFSLAKRTLKPNGRLVFFEPCYLRWQSAASRFFMSKDRGQGIRTERRWKELASAAFPCVQTDIVSQVNRFGYICIIAECRLASS